MKTRSPLAVAAVVGVLLAGLCPAKAQIWAPTGSPSNNWAAIACSADGIKLVAASGGQTATGQVYVSSDAATNWTPTTAPSLRWTSVACSADGVRLAAVAYNGGVYTSTNFGSDWTSNNLPASAQWLSVSSSADGSQLYSAPYGNFRVYHSTNGGALWLTNNTALADLLSVATSASGTLALAGDNHGHVQVSTNSGTNWRPSSTLSGVSANVSSVNVCGGGHRLTAVVFGGGGVYSSTNQGLSWFTNGVPPNSSWIGTASSADGGRLIIIGQKGPVYTSEDSGSTWVSNSVPGLFWQAVASSADGNVIFVAPSKGNIWVGRTNAPPLLALTKGQSNVTLSWLTPSSTLVLQQSSDLSSANWTDMTNSPTLDLSTLRQQLTIPATGARDFYRLKAE